MYEHCLCMTLYYLHEVTSINHFCRLWLSSLTLWSSYHMPRKQDRERGTQAHLGLQTVLLLGWLRELNQWWCRYRPRDPSVEFGETQRHCATYLHLSMSGKEGKRRVSERWDQCLSFTHVSSKRCALIRILSPQQNRCQASTKTETIWPMSRQYG